MTLPEWETRSQHMRNCFFLFFDLAIFTLLFVNALLHTLGVLAGSGPGPVTWALILVGLSASLYALFRCLKPRKTGRPPKGTP